MYDAFYPGREWLDTNGKPIQAHGGSIFYQDGVYYWYGENKEKTNLQEKIWTWGIRMYRSEDLYNWEDLGLIIPPDLEDTTSPLNPYTAKLDRPHILFNRHTGKYVCWCKAMYENGEQAEAVFTADSLTGPYVLLHKHLRPLGMDGGDFDLAQAEDGKAYYIFERVHSELIIADLDDTYTNLTGYYSTHFVRQAPPYVREAPAHFYKDYKHYLITSGTTSYFPNPSELACADTWHGPYHIIGDPHEGDESRTSWHSQISSVFHVPGTKIYIALADRWAMECLDIPYAYYEELFKLAFSGKPEQIPALTGKYGITEEQKEKMRRCDYQTSKARYVWLPLIFDHDRITIPWKDTWKLEDIK